MSERTERARQAYEAYETSDRELIESLLADDLTFYAPPDPGIDRETYFERCWPAAGHSRSFEIVRLIEDGDEVIITYEGARDDGAHFRNTEIMTFRGDQIVKIEVYFGWDL